jgi:undecaprenyl-diphosphatase
VSPFDWVQALDERMLVALHDVPTPIVVAAWILSWIGGGWGLFALLPWLYAPATRTRTLFLLASVGAASGLTTLGKALFGRPRPCAALPWCSALLVDAPTDPSLPSGHAAGAFAFAAFVALVLPRFRAPALAFAFLVALSRCVLGVHYPSDVVAGALLGLAVGAVGARLFQSQVRSNLRHA